MRKISTLLLMAFAIFFAPLALAQGPPPEVRPKSTTKKFATKTAIKSPALTGSTLQLAVEVDGRPVGIVTKPVKASAVPVHYGTITMKPGSIYQLRVTSNKPEEHYGIGIGIDGQVVYGPGNVPADPLNYNLWPEFAVIVVEGQVNQEKGDPIEGWRPDVNSDRVRQFLVGDKSGKAPTHWKDFAATGTIIIAVFPDADQKPKVVDDDATRSAIGTQQGDEVAAMKLGTTTFRAITKARELYVLHIRR
jgi:hypothetical protein